MMHSIWPSLALSGLILVAAPASADRRPVDANIVTAIDVSGSVDGRTERLEIDGLADALEHPAFIQAVRRGPERSIGFAAFTWSSQDDFMLVVPWQRIATADDADRVAAQLRGLRPGDRFPQHSYAQGGPAWRTSLDTDVSAAIGMAIGTFRGAPFPSDRKLLNLCANGVDNVGPPPGPTRDRAVAAGITINSLILRHRPEVADYFRAHVQGGPGAFVMTVRDRSDVVASMLTKFTLELARDRWIPDSPSPAQVLALTGGL